MRVEVYLRTDVGKEPQFLILPEGQTEVPLPARAKNWRYLFVMNTDDNVLDVPLTSAAASIRHKGFAILRPEAWSGDWATISNDEIEILSAPDGWQDKWHLA